MYRLHKRKGEYNTQRGNREEGGDCLNQQRRVLCFSPSLLPLSIVLLSICFLPSSSYLSDRVILSGLGLTSANRQGHTGRTACVASCSHCAVSFLFILNRTLALCPILFQRFKRRRRIEKCPVCISVCLVLWEGPAPFDHWAAAHPPACFAVSSAKKNSIGFRPPEVISCCLIGLCMCACECLWVCEEAYGLACYLSVCLYTFLHAWLWGKTVNLHACVNNSVEVKTSVCTCVYARLLTVLHVSFGHFNSLLPFNLK